MTYSPDSSGSIVRVVKRGGFTVLNNTAANDPRLSFKAVGLHTYLMTKPDNWQVYGNALSKTHTDGRESVYSGLRELETHGYLVRRVLRDEAGKIIGRESVVYEVSQDAEQDNGKTVLRETRITDKPDYGKPVANKDLPSTKTNTQQKLTLPEWISDELWADFLGHRKAIKKPLNSISAVRLIAELTRLREQGQDAARVLDQSIVNGWAGVFPIKAQQQAAQGTTRGAEANNNPYQVAVNLPEEDVNW